MAGPIRISILANASGASSAFASVSAEANGMGVRVGKAGKAMGLAVAAGAAVAGVAAYKFGKAAVSSASDAQQSLGATETVFGRYANTVIKRSNQAAKALGLSANEYRELSNVVGASLTGAGVPLKKTTDLTQQLNKRAADMAATFGGTTREAVESISSLMRGEADPIERYGVSIKQTDVNARLAAKGQDKLTGSALKQAEMQARLDILFQKTAKTQGAFGRESDTLAHQQQVLGAQWENLKAKVGSGLLPMLTRLLAIINANLMPAFRKVTTTVGPVVKQFTGLFDNTKQGNAVLAALSAFLAGSLVPALGDVVSAYQHMAETALPIIQQIAGAIGAKWSTIAPQVQAIWSSVQNIILDALSIIASVVGIATKAVSAIWQRFGDTLLRFTTGSLANVVSALRGAFQIVEGVFKVVSSLLRGDWKGAWDGIKKILSGALTVIRASLSQAWTTLRAAASIAWTAFKAVIAKAWDGVVALVRLQIGSVVALVKGIKDKITAALSGAKDWLKGIGVDIVRGLIAGIDSVIDWVRQAVERLADKIPGWVKKRLGIASPSKVMRRLAAWIPAGLAVGITDGSTGVQKAVDSVTDLIQDRASSQIKRAQARIKSQATQIGDQIEAAFDAREKRLRKTLKGKALTEALNRNDAREDRSLKAVGLASAKAQKAIEEKIGAQRKVNLAILKKYKPWLDGLGAAQDAIASRLATAQAALEDMVKVQADYTAAVKDSVTASAALSSFGDGAGFGSIQDLIGQRTAAVQEAARWAEVINQLKGRLNDADLQDLISQGVGSLGTAETILSGGDAAITAMNDLAKQLTTIGTDLGTTLGDHFYAAGIAQQQSYIAGIQAEQAAVIASTQAVYAAIDTELATANAATSTKAHGQGKNIGHQTVAGLLAGVANHKKAIKKAAAALGDALVAAVKKTLGIASPSRVFKRIGVHVVNGLRIGLDNTYVKRSGAVLASSLAQGFGTPSLDAWVAAGGLASSEQTLTVRLTADQVDAVQQGRDLILKIDAARSAGVRARTF